MNLYLQGRTHDALTELQSSRGSFRRCARSSARAQAAAAADTALGGDVDDLSAVLAAVAKVMVMGELGRDGDLELALGYARAIDARSMAKSFYRFALAEAHCSALQLVGAAPGAQTAIDAIRNDELPPDVYRWVSMMRGSANLSLGRVELAVRQLRDALSAQPPAFLGGWLSRYYVDLAIALAVRGEPEAAGQYLGRLAALPHPETAYLAPMEMLATAWISASAGAVRRAIGAYARGALPTGGGPLR